MASQITDGRFYAIGKMVYNYPGGFMSGTTRCEKVRLQRLWFLTGFLTGSFWTCRGVEPMVFRPPLGEKRSCLALSYWSAMWAFTVLWRCKRQQTCRLTSHSEHCVRIRTAISLSLFTAKCNGVLPLLPCCTFGLKPFSSKSFNAAPLRSLN